jgi:hypothetical protein
MAPRKGSELEELVRTYFARQGFFALRSVLLRFEQDEVTDIDVWLYGRQAASVRTRSIVDVKDKRSPKAFERILWTRGMQLALGCDRAIVATTDSNRNVVRFAHQQNVAILTKSFIERLEKGITTSDRLTLEQFAECIASNPGHKQDGDWLGRIGDAKSALVSLDGFQAFNRAISSFRFFAERVETRPQYKEPALRAALFCAAIACIALDAALERMVYDDTASRYRQIADGVTYGDTGDGKVRGNIDTLLTLVAESMENGKAISQQIKGALARVFESVRAEIIAEFFSREHNASHLFAVARELDDRAHAVDRGNLTNLSLETKAVIGVLADYVQAKRGALMNGAPRVQQASGFSEASSTTLPPTAEAATPPNSAATPSDPESNNSSPNRKLL